MQVSKGLLTLLIIMSFTSRSKAQLPEVTVPILTCGAANGAMSHSLYEASDYISALISFPTYINEDSGERQLNAPVVSGSQSSNRLAFLNEKNIAFEKLFSNAKNNELSKVLKVKFQKENCVKYLNNGHSIHYCENIGLQKIGDLEVEKIELSIESQDRVNVNGTTKLYIAYFVIQVPGGRYGSSTLYTTAYPYYVGEAGISCNIHELEESS